MMAVLPTPAGPTIRGLFLCSSGTKMSAHGRDEARDRDPLASQQVSVFSRVALPSLPPSFPKPSALPMTGSSFPSFARAVKSTLFSLSACPGSRFCPPPTPGGGGGGGGGFPMGNIFGGGQKREPGQALKENSVGQIDAVLLECLPRFALLPSSENVAHREPSSAPTSSRVAASECVLPRCASLSPSFFS
jgi:hypothetical protein